MTIKPNKICSSKTFKLTFQSLLVVVVFLPISSHAQSQFLLSWEIELTNNFVESIDVEIWKVGTTPAEYTSSIDPSGVETYSFGDGSGNDFSGDDNTLYKIVLIVDEVENSFLYVQCDIVTTPPSGMEFYCPNHNGSLGDFRLKVSSEGLIELLPFSIEPPSGSLDVISHFSDSDWVFPYNLDTPCGGFSGSCDPGETKWFFTPQTSQSSYTFASKDLEQPTDQEWDFAGKTITIPTGKTMTINNGLTVASTTSLRFADDSAMIYDGIDNNFDVAAGSTILLGNDVRLTFESEVSLTGTSGSPITFSPLDGGDQWDYLDLKADGNDFDYVVFDGGDKTVEIRSDDNTFDNVTFKNGWRGVSSYYSTLGGRSSFTITDSFIQNNSSVGVVSYNADFAMQGTEVTGNGEAGVYLVNAISYVFADNLVENNATTATTRSGIEVNSGGELDAWDNAANTIKNNVFHEVSTTVSGLANLGTVVSSNPGGRNNIYDVGSQATGEKYISEGGTYDVVAEDNCWNTTTTPSSAFFSGSVDYDPFFSCGPYYSRQGFATAPAKSLRQRIQDARQVILESAPNYRAEDVADLFVLQRLDKSDDLNEKTLSYRLIRTVAGSKGAFLGKEAIAARERALLIEIGESVFLENYDVALQQVYDAEPMINIPSNQIELLFSKVSILESFRAYSSALNVLLQIEQHGAFSHELVPTMNIMREAISARLADADAAPIEFTGDAWAEGASKRDNLDNAEKNRLQSAEVSVYPNPFNPATTLRFNVPEQAHVSVSVFNALGQLVETLVNASLSSGLHQVRFDATGHPSGLYFVRSMIGTETITSQLVLLK